MKYTGLTIILHVTTLTLLFSIPLQAQSYNRKSIKEQIEEICKIYDVRFIYDSELETRFCADCQPLPRKMSLEKALDNTFSGTGVEWSIQRNGYIVLSLPKVAVVVEIEPEEMKDTLDASKITSDKYIYKLRSRSTGLEKIDGSSFNKGFAVLSSPDVIKTLQTLPGISSGTELLSGIYVHGGTGYDNLYLLDGVPIYQVSHLAGLFSSFNTDIIENVDFFKSGFPARYGGRMSSIVDVTSKDGDMHDYQGLVSIGLLDGRLQFEGPIIKGKTSFNVGLRRSWLDVLSAPTLAIINAVRYQDKTKLHYSFGDLNAKITHLFAPENKLTAGLYYGHDDVTIGFYYNNTDDDKYSDHDGFELDWGNIMTSIRWENRLSDVMTSDIKAYYTQYSNNIDYFSFAWADNDKKDGYHKVGTMENGGSIVYDIAAKADFNWTPSDTHDIRFGTTYEYHNYISHRMHEEYVNPSETSDGIITKGDKASANGHEISIYAEDNISVRDWFETGIGLRYVIFCVKGKSYHKVEPRISLNFALHENASLKLSYTEMNQYIHTLSTNNLDLPTNVILPSTAKVAPMLSRQLAAGVYCLLPKGFTLEIEGWFKTMEHLREYGGYSMFYPPIDSWENLYPEGKGLSYGAEFSLGYNTDKVNASAAYTLSWTKRKFDELWKDWFLNWNDNRHKLTLSAVYKISNKVDLYSAWNYHSGNRITVNMHKTDVSSPILIDSPNNVVLPPYHRLDLGVNIRKTTKRRNESIWNVSIYNAYCRMNPISAKVKTDENGNRYGVATGLIPIIPSFSYTVKF